MSAPTHRTRILIVDDEPELLFLFSQRLQSWGYEPLTADTGEQALRLAEEQRPDLILLDVVMPTMKGWDVCARLRENPATKNIPIVFLTALGIPDHIKRGLDLGAEDYLVKPCEPEDLRDRIRIYLARHNSGTLHEER